MAEAMLSICTWYGLPKELLTDQGSVFVGKLMTDLRKKLHISRIKTSPYHSQTGGLLERWHGPLKEVLELGMVRWSEMFCYHTVCLPIDLLRMPTLGLLNLNCSLEDK